MFNFWKKLKIIHNPSRPAEYYSQRNNKKRPASSCFATSDVNMLFTARKYFPYPEGMQPEDYITELLLSDEALKYARSINIKAPREQIRLWYRMHVWVINEKLFQEQVCKYVSKITIQEIVFLCSKNKPVIAGGSFTESGHMVCIVGFQTRQLNIYKINDYRNIDISLVDYIIIDDPYGDYHSDYKKKKGDNIKFTIDEIKKLIKGNAIVLV